MSAQPKTNAQASRQQIVAIDERSVSFVPFGAGTKEELTLTVGMVRNFIAVKTKSGKVPSDAQLVKFMMLCKARQLNPFEGDAYLVGYDTQDGPQFSLITAHQAFLKRAEVNPNFDGMESGVIVDDGQGQIIERQGDFVVKGEILLGGWAKVHLKNRSIPTYRRLNLQTFVKNTKIWRENPQGMIVKCFDEETEILTTNGFEKFSDATGQVLQVTPQGLQPTDAQPFVQAYDGKMVTLESDDLNFCVTPNHDMLTTAGKIEAGDLFSRAQSRAKFWIPRCVQGCNLGYGMSLDAIKLAAIYLADGWDKPCQKFWVAVSRQYKVDFIESLGMHGNRHVQAISNSTNPRGRTVIATKEKQVFGFDYGIVSPLVQRGKQVNMAGVLSLSREQARAFVDTLAYFDGSIHEKTGVRRFHSSNPEIIKVFEVAAIQAGYAVSPRWKRRSDIGSKDAFDLTISERNEIGVRRWGRDYKNHAKTCKTRHTGLELTDNHSGQVWCVTVPSGLIVVRRHGFSMVTGNCAESDALRGSFPTVLGGMFLEQPMDDEHREVKPRPASQIELVRAKLADLPPKANGGTQNSAEQVQEQQADLQPGEIVDADYDVEPEPQGHQVDLPPQEPAAQPDDYAALVNQLGKTIAEAQVKDLADVLAKMREQKANGDLRDEDFMALAQRIEARQQSAPGKRGKQ